MDADLKIWKRKEHAPKNLRAFRKLLEIGTEEDFVKAMRAFGLREGSKQFLASLEIWRGYRS